MSRWAPLSAAAPSGAAADGTYPLSNVVVAGALDVDQVELVLLRDAFLVVRVLGGLGIDHVEELGLADGQLDRLAAAPVRPAGAVAVDLDGGVNQELGLL